MIGKTIENLGERGMIPRATTQKQICLFLKKIKKEKTETIVLILIYK